jgi:hypothetical protein
MPYPAYSIVIIESTTNGVTSNETLVFKTKSQAETFYLDAVNEGKRAFLYEQPQPSSFRRNDSQPMSA